MEREDNRKEEDKGQPKEIKNSSAKPSDNKSAADASEVVKDENIPVTYINTKPNAPRK